MSEMRKYVNLCESKKIYATKHSSEIGDLYAIYAPNGEICATYAPLASHILHTALLNDFFVKESTCKREIGTAMYTLEIH